MAVNTANSLEGDTSSVHQAKRKVTKWINRGLWFQKHSGKVNSAVLKSSTRVFGQSTSSDSSQHSAGASKALAQASKFLETLLIADGLTVTQQRNLDRYLDAIERQPIHQIEATDQAEEFQGSEETWRLILLAAQASKDVYPGSPGTPSSLILESAMDFKRTAVSIREVDGQGRVLLVAIRGSTSMMDWLVNANTALVFSKKLSGTTTRWHQGFLAVAEKMQQEVINAIIKTLENLSETEQAEGIDLIFTGHSAGGAIAKLFYAMSASPTHAMFSIVPRFRRLHCIVFGAPPVTTSPIMQPRLPPFQSGLFLTIVNEGDPVPLIQPEYVNALLQFFIVSAKALEVQYPEGFKVPDPVFRVSGSCVVLRDKDPEDVTAVGWSAVVIRADVLECKLFGNPAAHQMTDYLQRVQSLAKDIPSTLVDNPGLNERSISSMCSLAEQ